MYVCYGLHPCMFIYIHIQHVVCMCTHTHTHTHTRIIVYTAYESDEDCEQAADCDAPVGLITFFPAGHELQEVDPSAAHLSAAHCIYV